MKIVADDSIPLIDHYFGNQGELILKPGRDILHEDVIDAEILLVRSITPVTQQMLQNTKVKFVGSTTIGFDHIDVDWLKSQSITWATAKDCNAQAVINYVIATFAALQNKGLLTSKSLTVGVVGVGTIGSKVANFFKTLGLKVILCDPIRADQETHFTSMPLAQLSQADLITFHTPLTVLGTHPTYHMVAKDLLQLLKPGCVLLNTSRGSVINFSDLKQFGQHLHWCLDVWENEPLIDLSVLDSALFATPHVAGYSVQSKLRGINLIYQAAVAQNAISDKSIKIPSLPKATISAKAKHYRNWRDVVVENLDLWQASVRMKDNLINNQKTFDALRQDFASRMEFEFVEFTDLKLSSPDLVMLQKIGFDMLIR